MRSAPKSWGASRGGCIAFIAAPPPSRTTAEDVRTNIVRCPGCARWLLVRDHYSRRLAAYMGVMADAEAPGELPAIKEVFV